MILSPLRRIILCGLFTVFVAAAFGIAQSRGSTDHELRLTVLHVNDTHGYYVPYKIEGIASPAGGLTKATTLINRVLQDNRAAGRETLLLHGGDLLTGTPFSMVFKGSMGVDLLNRMGFQAMVVGNHDFDYGKDNLIKNLLPAMSFPLLSANITDEKGAPVFRESVVMKFAPGKTRVFIFGLTTEDTPAMTLPDNVKGLRFHNAIEAAQRVLKDVSDDDLVIALTHLGALEDLKLAAACPKIDIIVGGHSHTALFEPFKVGDCVIVQAGAYSKYLGRLDLEVVDGKVQRYRGGLALLGPEIPEDPALVAIVNQYKPKMDAGLQQVIGRSDIFLDGSMSSVRADTPCDLGKLVALAVAQGAKADMALINGGSIRASLHKGEITVADLYTMLPFPDHVFKFELKGKDLAAVLQRSADLPPGSGGILGTYGVSFRKENGRVIVEKVGDAAFDPEKTYFVATNGFLVAGGDGYTIFKEKGTNFQETPFSVSDLMAELIKGRKVIGPDVIDIIR